MTIFNAAAQFNQELCVLNPSQLKEGITAGGSDWHQNNMNNFGARSELLKDLKNAENDLVNHIPQMCPQGYMLFS